MRDIVTRYGTHPPPLLICISHTSGKWPTNSTSQEDTMARGIRFQGVAPPVAIPVPRPSSIRYQQLPREQCPKGPWDHGSGHLPAGRSGSTVVPHNKTMVVSITRPSAIVLWRSRLRSSPLIRPFKSAIWSHLIVGTANGSL